MKKSLVLTSLLASSLVLSGTIVTAEDTAENEVKTEIVGESGLKPEESDIETEESDVKTEESDVKTEESEKPAEKVDATEVNSDTPAAQLDEPAKKLDAPAEDDKQVDKPVKDDNSENTGNNTVTGDNSDTTTQPPAEEPIEKPSEEPKPSTPVITDTEDANIKRVTRKEVITHRTKTISDKSKPEGVVTAGKNGSKEVTYEVTYKDGKPQTAKRISETVLEEAQDEIINKHEVETTTTVSEDTSTSKDDKESKTEKKDDAKQTTTGSSNTTNVAVSNVNTGKLEKLPNTGEVNTFLPMITTFISGLGLLGFNKRRKG